MIRPRETTPSEVSAEDIQRQLHEYRRLGFEAMSPAHMVYPPSQHSCPWAGCECRISAIAFHLDRMGDAEQGARWLHAWWQGAGLVGKCPGCKHLVRYGMNGKEKVTDAGGDKDALLPENWYCIAQLNPPFRLMKPN